MQAWKCFLKKKLIVMKRVVSVFIIINVIPSMIQVSMNRGKMGVKYQVELVEQERIRGTL